MLLFLRFMVSLFLFLLYMHSVITCLMCLPPSCLLIACLLIPGASKWWEDWEDNTSSPFVCRTTPRGCNRISGAWSKDKWMLVGWATSIYFQETSGILVSILYSLSVCFTAWWILYCSNVVSLRYQLTFWNNSLFKYISVLPCNVLARKVMWFLFPFSSCVFIALKHLAHQ